MVPPTNGGPAPGSEQTVSYGPDPRQLLDIYAPPLRAGPSPALLLIHGGGWRIGSRTGLARQCRVFVQAGLVAISVDYRLTTGEPGTTWPAQFNDVQLAMRWVRSHADAHGIDPSRICARGDSAGGQLALLLGVVPGIGPGDMQDVLPGVSPRADCVVSISGQSNLQTFAEVAPNFVRRLVGPGEPTRTEAMVVDASPALRAQPGAAPALLLPGLQDAVALAQAEAMHAALARVGTPSWLVSYPGAHVLAGLNGPQLRDVTRLIGHFVRSHALPGPPRRLTLAEAASSLR